MTGVKPIKVLLADDHELVRAGIRALLDGIAGIEVVGETGDGREALRLVEHHRPHVLLTDISMPGLNGLDAAARVSREHPRTRVIVLSMHTDEAYILQALRSGVAGYLPKAAARSELELAIKAVARGETYLSPATSKHLVREYLSRATTLEGPLSRLTVRHREILQLIAEGCTSKEIASRLGITVKTVDRQRTELMKRLDLHDIAGLVRFAIREGLILPGA